MEALRKEAHYTYTDYARWDDTARYELVDGIPRLMAAPSQAHQEIIVEICRQLSNFLRGK
jgi:Uma2 family endonuclease